MIMRSSTTNQSSYLNIQYAYILFKSSKEKIKLELEFEFPVLKILVDGSNYIGPRPNNDRNHQKTNLWSPKYPQRRRDILAISEFFPPNFSPIILSNAAPSSSPFNNLFTIFILTFHAIVFPHRTCRPPPSAAAPANSHHRHLRR